MSIVSFRALKMEEKNTCPRISSSKWWLFYESWAAYPCIRPPYATRKTEVLTLDKKLRERHLRQRKNGWRRGWNRCSGHHQHLPLGQSIFHATIGVSCVLSVLPATEKFGMPSVQTVTVKKEKSSRNWKILKGVDFMQYYGRCPPCGLMIIYPTTSYFTSYFTFGFS